MADNTSSKFPTMGTQAAQANNVSGAPSANTKPVAKHAGPAGGEAATAVARKGTLERNGFKGAPQVNHVYPNAPEASDTFRNVRLVPSAVGNRDFWAQRQYGQTS